MRLPLSLLFVLFLASCQTAQESSTSPVTRKAIQTPDAPQAIGPYSQAIRAGNHLFLSGQIGLDPRTGKLVEGGIEAETQQALLNLDAILRAAGFKRSDVVQAQVFLADLEDYAAMNDIYAAFFEGMTPPARAAVQVAQLPRNARVEIMMTAVQTP